MFGRSLKPEYSVSCKLGDNGLGLRCSPGGSGQSYGRLAAWKWVGLLVWALLVLVVRGCEPL